MSNGKSLVVTGSVTVDRTVTPESIRLESRRIVVTVDAQEYCIEVDEEPAAGRKVTWTGGTLPSSIPGNSHIGGGAANSARQAARIADGSAALHYYDSGRVAPRVLAELTSAGLMPSFAGMHEIPTNLVLGLGGDKLIVREPIVDGDRSCTRDSLPVAGSYLINSVKLPSPSLCSALTAETDPGRLTCVITRSTPGWFVQGFLLPHAGVIIAAADEMGAGRRNGLAEAFELLGRFCIGGAIGFVTLGKGGVVTASSPGTGYHIALTSAASELVQSRMRDTPAFANGAGDAFAGGVFVHVGLGAALRAAATSLPACVQTGIAGCMAALDWMHCGDLIRPDDFDIRPTRCTYHALK